MAILRNDTVVKSADGQHSSAIITAANIGSHSIAPNSTYFIGTTQNVFNRASGAQTLTGVSIDGNAANITAYTINQNVGTGNTPSFAGITSTAMLTSYTSLSNNYDWQNSPITIRERGLVSNGQSSDIYSPNINFHWAMRWSSSLWMNQNGNLNWGGYSDTGVPGNDGVFRTGSIYANIYYDKNNTTYYLDAANSGTSLLVAGNIGIGTTSANNKLTIQEVGTDGTPLIRLITTSAPATFSWFMSAMNSSLTAGKNYIGLIGQAESQNNSAYIGFNFQGAGSTSNFLTFGFYQNDNLLNLRASGNVGIGTTSPATKLDIYGPVSVRGTTVLTTNFDLNAGNAADIYANIRVLRGASLNDGMYIGYGGAGGNLKFFSNSGTTEFMTIATTGNVGVGNTNPSYKLDVSGAINTSTYVYAGVFYDNDNTAYYTNPTGTSNLNAVTLNSSGSGGYLTLPGSITVSNVSGAEMVIRGLSQLRFSNSTSWDWNAWAGLRYDNATTTIYLGGPAATGIFTQNATPPTVTVSFVGTNNVTSDSNFKGPIFYDSADTTYYLDPANTGTALAIAGNAGVGTASPTLSSGKGIHINSSSGHANLKLQSSGRTWELLSTTGAYFSVYDTTGGADRLTVTSGGNVGVATTAADTNLQVVGHVHVGNQTTFENTGGWNKTIYLDGTIHARMRILGSAYASGKNSATETSIWVDNSVAPYSGLTTNAGSFTINAGFTTLTNSARSPIFYDSDNTAYYIDAASTSVINAISIAGNSTFSTDSHLTFGPNSTWGSSIRFGGNGYTATGTEMASVMTTDGNLHLDAAKSTNGIYLNWYGGTSGVFFGNGSAGQVGHVSSSGNASFSGSVTSTYGNFTTPGLIIGDAQYGFYVSGGNVYYKSASGGVHYWRNIANSANTMSLDNSGNILLSGYINASSYIYTATYLQTGGNLIYPSGYGATQRLEVSNSANNNWIDGLTIAPGGIVTAPNEMRSPIFYDSDNTAYYINAASTSVLNALTVGGNSVLTTASTLTAGNLSGTIPSGVLGNSTLYVGTTAIALNRGSASQTLTGISIDGNAATATTATNSTQLGGVAAANYVRNDVDGTDSTALFRLTTITKSLTITTSWLDTGIVGANLATGCYMISVYVDNYAVNGGHYQETYTGMMSWFSTGTNSTDYDEIVLHKSGHASNGAYINLRTIRQLSGSTNLKLQIISSVSTNGASNYVFKFRRLI